MELRWGALTSPPALLFIMLEEKKRWLVAELESGDTLLPGPDLSSHPPPAWTEGSDWSAVSGLGTVSDWLR